MATFNITQEYPQTKKFFYGNTLRAQNKTVYPLQLVARVYGMCSSVNATSNAMREIEDEDEM